MTIKSDYAIFCFLKNVDLQRESLRRNQYISFQVREVESD